MDMIDPTSLKLKHILSLRRARPDDAAAVRALTRCAYAKWVPQIGREPKPMTADHDHAIRHHLVDLLFIGTALVGLVEMIPAEGFLLIENVAVAPEAQGRGFGRRLIAHAEALAAERGLTEVTLYTNAAFTANIALYLRLGYAVTRREPFPAGGVTVYMAKHLAPAAPP